MIPEASRREHELSNISSMLQASKSNRSRISAYKQVADGEHFAVVKEDMEEMLRDLEGEKKRAEDILGMEDRNRDEQHLLLQAYKRICTQVSCYRSLLDRFIRASEALAASDAEQGKLEARLVELKKGEIKHDKPSAS